MPSCRGWNWQKTQRSHFLVRLCFNSILFPALRRRRSISSGLFIGSLWSVIPLRCRRIVVVRPAATSRKKLWGTINHPLPATESFLFLFSGWGLSPPTTSSFQFFEKCYEKKRVNNNNNKLIFKMNHIFFWEKEGRLDGNTERMERWFFANNIAARLFDTK